MNFFDPNDIQSLFLNKNPDPTSVFKVSKTFSFFQGELREKRLDSQAKKIEEIKEIVCSFLNQEGGNILFGITSVGKMILLREEELQEIKSKLYQIFAQISPNPNLGKFRIGIFDILVEQNDEMKDKKFLLLIRVDPGDKYSIYSTDYLINCCYRTENGKIKKYSREQLNMKLDGKLKAFSEHEEVKVGFEENHDEIKFDKNEKFTQEEFERLLSLRSYTQQGLKVKIKQEASPEEIYKLSPTEKADLLKNSCAFLNRSGGVITIACFEDDLMTLSNPPKKFVKNFQAHIMNLIEDYFGKVEAEIQICQIKVSGSSFFQLILRKILNPTKIFCHDKVLGFVVRVADINYQIKNSEDFSHEYRSRLQVPFKKEKEIEFFDLTDKEKQLHQMESIDSIKIRLLFAEISPRFTKFLDGDWQESSKDLQFLSEQFKNSVCGFLNDHGGRIYIGITEKGQAKGIEKSQVDYTLLKLCDLLYEIYPLPIAGGQRVDFRIFPIKDKTGDPKYFVIKVFVKPGDPEYMYSVSRFQSYFPRFEDGKFKNYDLIKNGDEYQEILARRIFAKKIHTYEEDIIKLTPLEARFLQKSESVEMKMEKVEEKKDEEEKQAGPEVIEPISWSFDPTKPLNLFENSYIEYKDFRNLDGLEGSDSNFDTVINLIASFLNRSGGKILFGITNNRIIEGIFNEKLEEFIQIIQESLKFFSPKLSIRTPEQDGELVFERIEIKQRDHKEKKYVLVLNVQPKRTNACYFENRSGSGLYIRVGPSSRKIEHFPSYIQEYKARRLGNITIDDIFLSKVSIYEELRDFDEKLLIEEPKLSDESLILKEKNEKDANKFDLPIMEYKDEIIKAINKNTVTIIKANTGTGKTIRVSQFIREIPNSKRIALCQPYPQALESIAQRISDESGEKVFVINDFKQDKSGLPERCIVVMRHSTMINEILYNPDLDQYSHIIIDEAHERILDTDVLLSFMLCMIKEHRIFNNSKLGEEYPKFVISSATIDINHIWTFIKQETRTEMIEIDAEMNHEVKKHFNRYEFSYSYFSESDPRKFNNSPEDTTKFLAEILKEIKDNIIPEQHVLVFPPDGSYVKRFFKDYSKKAEFTEKFQIIQIHDESSFGEVYANTSKSKLIFASKKAQVGITIPNLYYVVDCGWDIVRKYNRYLGINEFVNVRISKSTSRQRQGRLGRTNKGEFYPMYSESDFEKMKTFERTALDNYSSGQHLLYILLLKTNFFTKHFIQKIRQSQDEEITKFKSELLHSMIQGMNPYLSDEEVSLHIDSPKELIRQRITINFGLEPFEQILKNFVVKQQITKLSFVNKILEIRKQILNQFDDLNIFNFKLIDNEWMNRKIFTQRFLSKIAKNQEKQKDNREHFVNIKHIVLNLLKIMNPCLLCDKDSENLVVPNEHCLRCKDGLSFNHKEDLLTFANMHELTLNNHELYFMKFLKKECEKTQYENCLEDLKLIFEKSNKSREKEKEKITTYIREMKKNSKGEQYERLQNLKELFLNYHRAETKEEEDKNAILDLMSKIKENCEDSNIKLFDSLTHCFEKYFKKKTKEKIEILRENIFSEDITPSLISEMQKFQAQGLKHEKDKAYTIQNERRKVFFTLHREISKEIEELEQDQKEKKKRTQMSISNRVYFSEDLFQLQSQKLIKGVIHEDLLFDWNVVDAKMRELMFKNIYLTPIGQLSIELDQSPELSVSFLYSHKYGVNHDMEKALAIVKNDWTIFNTLRKSKKEILLSFGNKSDNSKLKGEYEVYLDIFNAYLNKKKEIKSKLDRSINEDRQLYYMMLQNWAESNFIKWNELKKADNDYKNFRKLSSVLSKKIEALKDLRPSKEQDDHSKFLKALFQGFSSNIIMIKKNSDFAPVFAAITFEAHRYINYNLAMDSIVYNVNNENLLGNCIVPTYLDIDSKGTYSDKPFYNLKCKQGFYIKEAWLEELPKHQCKKIEEYIKNPKEFELLAETEDPAKFDFTPLRVNIYLREPVSNLNNKMISDHLRSHGIQDFKSIYINEKKNNVNVNFTDKDSSKKFANKYFKLLSKFYKTCYAQPPKDTFSVKFSKEKYETIEHVKRKFCSWMKDRFLGRIEIAEDADSFEVYNIPNNFEKRVLPFFELWPNNKKMCEKLEYD